VQFSDIERVVDGVLIAPFAWLQVGKAGASAGSFPAG
jgi:hypothetical protein